ncbi:MAG: DEAD/DEAH box helicase family protein [Thermotogae bacterium]|nr:DEAD/DEAH box helicase family protein [Thermotogota bacterium]
MSRGRKKDKDNIHIYLQHMVEAISDDHLPANWRWLDVETFSKDIRLWDYQQKAIQNAIKLLWKYYEDFRDFKPDEDLDANAERKRRLWQWYQNNGLSASLDIDLKDKNYRLRELLLEYYPETDGKIPYEHFINRACFWMATGSGKTLVIVKLIEILWKLMQRGEIPRNNILVLTHRDDLIEQFKRHVDEFNWHRRDFNIVLKELREYEDVLRQGSLLKEQEAAVFYYRSDNLSDEQKEKIVDFRNYDNDGQWYVLLDEAHKGDKEESKRQHIYAILSRNGFLFNFSATFTDSRDIATTLFNFNLAEYIRAGYGKHIYILKQEMRAFRNEEDYTGEEKQKVVLKALLMLAYTRKVYEGRQDKSAYHKPLMLVLVNSVNTEDADLLLFFRELERIGRGEISEDISQQAKEELLEELRERPSFVFEEGNVEIDENLLNSLTPQDLMRLVFNAESPGEIEVLVRPSDRKEMAFKLKSADRPFALIKIGDISKWLKEKLAGYEINERFDDEGYFVRLNEDDSEINILMGSRTFYEGWDSNRPNVICYINIGGKDAKKFILQSIGRGVRIEPIKGKRRRLRFLYNAGIIDEEKFKALQPIAKTLETLFVFGTKREALKKVVENLEQERAGAGERHLDLFEINPEAENKLLLVPVYREVEALLAERRELSKFPIAQDELEILRTFVQSTDDRVILMLTDIEPRSLRLLKVSLSEYERFYRIDGKQRYGDVIQLVRRVAKYFSIPLQEVESLKPLKDEIRHFKHITVMLEDIEDLRRKIEKVRKFKNSTLIEQELKRQLEAKEISLDEYTKGIKQVTRTVSEGEEYSYDGLTITIKHIVQHYYLPVVIAESERVNYIRHIIKTQSERQFIRQLEKYIDQPDNGFQAFDWWMFSKIDESLDEVYIPYYDPKANRIARFKPDFIFWLQKGSDYFIVFVDPKGTEYRDADRKLEGYRMIFEDKNGQPKVFRFNRNGSQVKVRVLSFLWTTDRANIPGDFKQYWIDGVSDLANRCRELLSED